MTHPLLARLRDIDPVERSGKIMRIFPTSFEADGPCVPMGTLCTIETAGSHERATTILAEAVRVDERSITLVPYETGALIVTGARVVACENGANVPVGDAFMGRAVDAFGRPIDGKPLYAEGRWPIQGKPTPAFSRTSPSVALETGIRAIDGLLTLGKGQRVGIFAASGVGKTSLVTQLTRQIDAGRCVICLTGERGREVEGMWSEGLPKTVRARSALVAATSDQSAAMRVRAAHYALCLAEYWRDRGHNVLFVLDSITRLAMAMREVGLAAGEPPTVRAYTPSVFSELPKLVERCGALKSGGSISAVMTVLCETDETDDPISETMKSLLDGHIILSRSLAEQGHFPAIDIPRSISRQSAKLMDKDHRRHATAANAQLSRYEESKTLIESGIYAPGSNPEIDQMLRNRPALLDILKQEQEVCISLAETRQLLTHVVKD